MNQSRPRSLALGLLVLCTTLALFPRAAEAVETTVVVEVAGADGKLVPGDVKVRKAGSPTVIKSTGALTGEGQIGGLAAGDYEFDVTTRMGGLVGTRRASIVAGKVQRLRVVVSAPATARTATASPMMRGTPTRSMAGISAPAATPSGGVLRGTIKTATGAPATGTVRIVLELPLTAGGYAVKGLPPGSYRVEHTPAGKPVVTRSVTLGASDQVVDLVAK